MSEEKKQEDDFFLSIETALWFDIYAESSHANNHLPENVEKLDRGQLQAVTTSIFIQTNMGNSKNTYSSESRPTKDGYPEDMPTERAWNGSERVTGGKHYDEKNKIGKQYKDLPFDYLVYMADRQNPNYPNKSQFELDRRESADE